MRLVERAGRIVADSPRRAEAARALRRGFGVHFYQGRNGSGKTLAMVLDTLPDLEDGKPVLSTVRLLDYADPRPCDDPACWCDKSDPARHAAAHPLWVPWSQWSQLLGWDHGVVLADEVTGIADSMDGASLPSQVGNMLAQLRRAEVVLRLTGLNFIRANKRIREATTGLTRCESSWSVSALDEQGRPRMWRPRRLATWRTYDAQSLPLDDVTEAAFERADLIITSRHWIPSSPAISAYDTYDAVLRIGTVTDAGRCAYCGGVRRAPACSCSDYGGHPAPVRRARA